MINCSLKLPSPRLLAHKRGKVSKGEGKGKGKGRKGRKGRKGKREVTKVTTNKRTRVTRVPKVPKVDSVKYGKIRYLVPTEMYCTDAPSLTLHHSLSSHSTNKFSFNNKSPIPS